MVVISTTTATPRKKKNRDKKKKKNNKEETTRSGNTTILLSNDQIEESKKLEPSSSRKSKYEQYEQEKHNECQGCRSRHSKGRQRSSTSRKSSASRLVFLLFLLSIISLFLFHGWENRPKYSLPKYIQEISSSTYDSIDYDHNRTTTTTATTNTLTTSSTASSFTENKTLVILMGNLRCGELAWQSLYRNILDPNNADLALLIGKPTTTTIKEENKNIDDDQTKNDFMEGEKIDYNHNSVYEDASLFQRAKYVWRFPEYNDWADALDLINGTAWRTTMVPKLSEENLKKGIIGGALGTPGSSAITNMIKYMLFHILQRGGVVLSRPNTDDGTANEEQKQLMSSIQQQQQSSSSSSPMADLITGIISGINKKSKPEKNDDDDNQDDETGNTFSLRQYEYFVITRTDQYYMCPLNFSKLVDWDTTVWVPIGEDYSGVCDRFYIVHKNLILQSLNILPPFLTTDEHWKRHYKYLHNPEGLLRVTWNRHNINIRRFARTMFTCTVPQDPKARWSTIDFNDQYQTQQRAVHVPTNINNNNHNATGTAYLKYPLEYPYCQRGCAKEQVQKVSRTTKYKNRING